MQNMHLEFLKGDCTRPHLTNKPLCLICVMYLVLDKYRITGTSWCL